METRQLRLTRTLSRPSASVKPGGYRGLFTWSPRGMQARLPPMIRERMRRGASIAAARSPVGRRCCSPPRSSSPSPWRAISRPIPSLNTAAGGPPRNIFGLPGALARRSHAQLRLGRRRRSPCPLMFILGHADSRGTRPIPNWRRLARRDANRRACCSTSLWRCSAAAPLPACPPDSAVCSAWAARRSPAGWTDARTVPPLSRLPLRYTLHGGLRLQRTGADHPRPRARAGRNGRSCCAAACSPTPSL